MQTTHVDLAVQQGSPGIRAVMFGRLYQSPNYVSYRCTHLQRWSASTRMLRQHARAGTSDIGCNSKCLDSRASVLSSRKADAAIYASIPAYKCSGRTALISPPSKTSAAGWKELASYVAHPLHSVVQTFEATSQIQGLTQRTSP